MSKDFVYGKTINIDGKEYKLQKLPVREALELKQRSKDENGNPCELKMYPELLTHVVVSPPNLTFEEFEDVVTLEKLMSEAINYQYASKGK